MNSAFFEFNVAVTGLHAAKMGLSVATNNVSNMATEGYTRQVIQQKASIPLPTGIGKGMQGTGTEVYGIGQIRDFFIDKKYWTQQAVKGEYTEKNDQLELVETVFNEISTAGLSSTLTDFFNNLSSLTFSSENGTYRSNVISCAENFVSEINSYAETLKQQQSDINQEIDAIIKRINSIGDQVAALNKQIVYYELDGSSANDLRDQRALLIDELSTYVNVEVKEVTLESGSKYYSVLINGQSLVEKYDVNKLKAVERTEAEKLNAGDANGLYKVCFEHGEIDFNFKGASGELKGLIESRDGNDGNNGTPNYKGIPYYINRLNDMVRTIARAFNEGKYSDGTEIKGVTGHVNGYTAYGEKGGLLFTYKNMEDGQTYEGTDIDYNDITAFNFSVADSLKKDPSKLAASTSFDEKEESNNEVILGFINLQENDDLFKQGNVFDYINGVASELAIDKNQAQDFTDFYEELTKATFNQRQSVSGVSINEEMSNMIKYQELYQACAQVISAINKIYDTTINGLGI